MSELSQPFFKTRVESRLKATKDVEEFRYVAHIFIQELGFSDFACAGIVGEHNFDISVSTISRDMVSAYMDNELFQYDTMLECLICGTEYAFQRTIFDHIFSAPYQCERVRKNKVLKSIMDRHGIYDCFAIPVHNWFNGKREVVAMSVYCKEMSSADFQDRAKKNIAKLTLLANCFYSFGYNRYARVASRGERHDVSSLTKRELEVLKLYPKYDFNSDKVAAAMNRSKYTIQKHTENIRKKLNVNTTYEAMMLGVKQGAIKL